MKKVAVLQSNYIPWKGYFDIIHDVDLFIFHDDLQYTKGDWRNRNLIKVSGKTIWITVPIKYIGHKQLLIDTHIDNKQNWQKKHYQSLVQHYGKAPHFDKYAELLKNIYFDMRWDYLYELNRYLTIYISRELLNIKTEFADSRDFKTHGVKHEKLLSLVKSAGADLYLSGSAAKDYIIEEDYIDAGIKLVWKDYSDYPQYKQLDEPFNHKVSILDLLFNTGEDAPYYIWGWRCEERL